MFSYLYSVSIIEINRQVSVLILLPQLRSWGRQNCSEQSCDIVLFHSIIVAKIRSTPNTKRSSLKYTWQSYDVIINCQFIQDLLFSRIINSKQSVLSNYKYVIANLNLKGLIFFIHTILYTPRWRLLKRPVYTLQMYIILQYLQRQYSIQKILISCSLKEFCLLDFGNTRIKLLKVMINYRSLLPIQTE